MSQNDCGRTCKAQGSQAILRRDIERTYSHLPAYFNIREETARPNKSPATPSEAKGTHRGFRAPSGA